MHQNEVLPERKTYKSFTQLFLQILCLCLSSFYFGYCLAYFRTFKFDNIKQFFHQQGQLPEILRLIIQGGIPIGAAFGSLFSFLLLKKFPRRKSLLTVNCLSLIVGCLILIPQSITFLIFCRISQGFCVGIYSVLIPIMIREFAPTEIYGSLGCLFQWLIACGVFTSYVLTKILGDKFTSQRYTLVFGFTLVTTVIQNWLLLFVYKFQTPKYLLSIKENKKCKEVLSYIYKEQFVETIFRQKHSQIYPFQESLLTDSQLQKITSGVQYRKIRILSAIHLSVHQQFCGINAVMNFYNYKKQFNIWIVFMSASLLSGTLLSIFLFSKFGRKKILQIGTICSITILLTLFILQIPQLFNLESCVIILLLYTGNYGATISSFSWVYIPEIVPPSVIPISMFFNWIAAITMTILPTFIKNEKYLIYVLGFCIVWYFVAFFINKKYVIETKGKAQEQIYFEYDKIK